MAVRLDPEQNETRALFDLAEFDGRNVLEIGCGDGRLTWRYADRAARVTAIDPFAEGIRRAKEALPRRLGDRVEFHHVTFEDFAAVREPAMFDRVILSWALC